MMPVAAPTIGSIIAVGLLTPAVGRSAMMLDAALLMGFRSGMEYITNDFGDRSWTNGTSGGGKSLADDAGGQGVDIRHSNWLWQNIKDAIDYTSKGFCLNEAEGWIDQPRR